MTGTPTPAMLALSTRYRERDWQPAYDALGDREDWPALARWLESTGPAMWPTVAQAMWPTVAQALETSGIVIGERPLEPGPELRGNVFGLVWSLARAVVRRAWVRLRRRARGDRGEALPRVLAFVIIGAAIVAVTVISVNDARQPEPIPTPTGITWTPEPEPGSIGPESWTYVVSFEARGARVTYMSINGERTDGRSIFTTRAPAALVLTVEGTDPAGAGSCMIRVDGAVVVEQPAKRGAPATCVWMLEEGFTA